MAPKVWTVACTSALLAFLQSGIALAADPPSGTISESSPSLTYTGGPLVGTGGGVTLSGTPLCATAASCDVFTLTVSLSAGYQALHPDEYVIVRIDWETQHGDSLRTDLDLYVHRDGTLFRSSSGISAAEVVYLPAVSATYVVRVVPFHATGETFTGTLSIGPPPATGRAAIYVPSADVWSRNLHLTGRVIGTHDGDREPAAKFDGDGNAWVSSNGPGTGLWKITDPCGQEIARFQEPETPPLTGGGDTDVETAPERNAIGFHNVYVSGFHRFDQQVNFNVSVSMDGGQTFVTAPLSTLSALNDSQWNAAYGANTVYLSYHWIAAGWNVYITRSDAAGLPGTWVGPFLVNQDVVIPTTLNNTLGTLAVDRRPAPEGTPLNTAGPDGQGALYQGFIQAGHKVYVAVSRDFGVNWTSHLVFDGGEGANYAHFFFAVDVDEGGNVYTAFSDDYGVYFCHSTDHGESWSEPVRVNNGPATKTVVFPALATGSPGRVLVSWFGAQGRDAEDPLNEWRVFVARCDNATAAVPVFEQTVASDHVIHSGRLCWHGASCAEDRELLDCFEIAVNPTDGSALIAYTDNSDGQGSFITRQLAGKSAIEGREVTDRSLSCPTSAPCPALEVSAPLDQAMTAGQTRTLEFTIVNAGLSAAPLAYQLDDALGWTVSSSAPLTGTTPPLAAGETFTLSIETRAPDSCPPGPETYTWTAKGTGPSCIPLSAAMEIACESSVAVSNVPRADFGLTAAPNPFAGETWISYRIPGPARVAVDVFSVEGRKMATLMDQVCDAGGGQLRLDSGSWPPGLYLVRMRAAGTTSLCRLMLMR